MNFKTQCIALTLVMVAMNFLPSSVSAQDGPIQFQYAGDMKAKYEKKELYIYIYCNKYEGDTCTSADGAVRLHVPNPTSWLKALIKI